MVGGVASGRCPPLPGGPLVDWATVPTYEYACRQCGEHLEVVQSFRDDPLTTCPNCEGDLRKVFHAIGISFKGSGFYRTDSRDSSSVSERPRKDAKDKDKAATDSSSKAPSPSPAAEGGKGDKVAGGSGAAKSGGSSPGKGDSKAAASS